jgi:hypothetical protein
MDKLIPTSAGSFIGGILAAFLWDDYSTLCSNSSIMNPGRCINTPIAEIPGPELFIFLGTAAGAVAGVLVALARWWWEQQQSN